MKRPPGRKSAASLSVVPIGERPRPEPPEKMIEAEKVVWRETTAALRPDWFQGAECVLGAYVGAVIMVDPRRVTVGFESTVF